MLDEPHRKPTDCRRSVPLPLRRDRAAAVHRVVGHFERRDRGGYHITTVYKWRECLRAGTAAAVVAPGLGTCIRRRTIRGSPLERGDPGSDPQRLRPPAAARAQPLPPVGGDVGRMGGIRHGRGRESPPGPADSGGRTGADRRRGGVPQRGDQLRRLPRAGPSLPRVAGGGGVVAELRCAAGRARLPPIQRNHSGKQRRRGRQPRGR